MLTKTESEILNFAKKLYSVYPKQTYCRHHLLGKMNNERRSSNQPELSEPVFDKAFFSLIKKKFIIEVSNDKYYNK